MRKLVPQDAILVPDNATKVFGGILFDVYQWPQAEFDGTIKTYEMLKRPDSVWVVCVDGDKVIVTVDEQPHRGRKITLPGGKAEPHDDTPLATAQRELREETGLECGTWRLIGCQQPQPKIEWFGYTYLATDITQRTPSHPESGERIEVKHVSFAELLELAHDPTHNIRYITNLLMRATSIQELLQLPEFTGKAVTR